MLEKYRGFVLLCIQWHTFENGSHSLSKVNFILGNGKGNILIKKRKGECK